MLGLVEASTAAFVIYERARTASGLASDVSSFIGVLLSTSKDEEVKMLLQRLLRRVDSISPALEFLCVWCRGRGSALEEQAFYVRSTLQVYKRRKGHISIICMCHTYFHIYHYFPIYLPPRPFARSWNRQRRP